MTVRISNPFPFFIDRFGNPLDGGMVYVGTEGDDPEVSPIDLFRDEALSLALPQPITVIGGLLTYDGNPVEIFAAEDTYSIRSRDSDGAQVFYVASVIVDAVSWQPLDVDLSAISAQANTPYGLGLLALTNAAALRSYAGITTENPLESLIVAASDEATPLTTGTAKITFRMPYAFNLTEVRASLTVAQASGSVFTVDVNEDGASILSTKITIDNGEKTSTTAAGAPFLSDTTLADDAEITIDIDQVGDGTAKGLKVILIGRRA